MSHVISAQPSATSPYQPTAMQEGNGADNPARIHRIDSEQNDDCCIHTRNKKGCCLYVCTLLSMCCQGIKNCTDCLCDSCANSLIDCCEDKPRDRNQTKPNQITKQKLKDNKRYKKSGGSYYDNTTDNDDDWGITSLSAQYTHVGVGNNFSEPAQDLVANSNDDYNSSTRHKSGHDSVTLPMGVHHKWGTHQSSIHHHDSGKDHSSSHHDSSTHHTSSHDVDTSTCHDSYGGGDTGGGCDSGGGGCDD